eukprot:IDg21420t1
MVSFLRRFARTDCGTCEAVRCCSAHKCGSLDRCVGFIDGTKIKIARPSGANSMQRSLYSGHKRVHGLTYQTVTAPYRLIFHLFRPVERRKSDA